MHKFILIYHEYSLIICELSLSWLLQITSRLHLNDFIQRVSLVDFKIDGKTIILQIIVTIAINVL